LHASYDLYELSWYSTEGRRLIFGDDTCETWRTILKITIDRLDDLSHSISRHLDAYVKAHKSAADKDPLVLRSKSLDKWDGVTLLLGSLDVLPDNRNTEGIGNMLSAAPSSTHFGAIAVVRGEIPPTLCWNATLWLASATSRLVACSLTEDSLGLVQSSQAIPLLLESLLSLYAALRAAMGGPHVDWLFSRGGASRNPLDNTNEQKETSAIARLFPTLASSLQGHHLLSTHVAFLAQGKFFL